MKLPLLLVLALVASTFTARGAVNDICEDATVIVPASACMPQTSELLDATQSLPPIFCGGFTASDARDVWFVFTAVDPYSRVQTVGTSLDLVIEVFSGSCSVLVSEACADDQLLSGVEDLQIATTPGTDYYVRVYAWTYVLPPGDLEFSICVFTGTTPPPNDECGNVTAVPLAPGGSALFTGTTPGATIGGDYATGSPLLFAGPAVWHAFDLADCAQVTIAYCGTLPVFQNTFVVLARNCPADTLVYASSWDQISCAEPNVTFRFDELEAGLYYLPVLYDVVNANGAYQVNVSTVACEVGLSEATSAAGIQVLYDVQAGVWVLRLSGPLTQGELQIWDMQGALVFRERWPARATEHHIRLPRHRPHGVLALRVAGREGSWTTRIGD